MKFLKQSSFKATLPLAALTLTLGWLNAAALAAENNAAGTWKASFTTADGQTIESTLKIKQEGAKFNGVIVGRNGNEYPIDEIKLTGDDLAIKSVRERNGEKITTTVAAKLSGDTLKGKLQSNYGGENRTADWQAKREGSTTAAASSAAAGTTGSWKYAITVESGDALNLVLNLKQEGENVTGKVSMGDFEAPITEGKVVGDAISFKIPVDTGGQKFTSKYKGTLSGDTIKGKIDSDWGGENHNYDWNATREKAAASSTASAGAGSAAGTWNWVLTTEGGDSIELSLKLKQDGEKLSGVVVLGDNEAPILEGLVKDNEVTLKVTREEDGKTQVAKFKGKLNGDSIKGKIESDWSGENKTYDWNASREKTAGSAATASAGAGNATGTWNWVLTTEGGDSIELSLKLKQEGDKLSGVVVLGDNEAPILEGLVKDNEVTLKVTREEDGKTQVAKFKGKLDGNSIKGKIESDWSGESKTYDWNAKRSI
ncbi:MAG: hypothetical protein HY298_15295 [Verrucomicrobia bacterium]|nr:hypothetical protein [Verrucomicrobiota bacterium]